MNKETKLFQLSDNNLEHRTKINNINVTIKFSDKPNRDTQDQILEILMKSYESRVISQNSIL
jgi:hypothetical protein